MISDHVSTRRSRWRPSAASMTPTETQATPAATAGVNVSWNTLTATTAASVGAMPRISG